MSAGMALDRSGWSLLYDAHIDHCNPILQEAEVVREAVCDVVVRLCSETHVDPVVYPVVYPSQDGFTVMTVLPGGHLILHAWPSKDRFTLDVFSREQFDEQALGEFVSKRFGVVKRSEHVVYRMWSLD